MKRPKQHETGTAAENIFRNLIPTAWVINEHFNDYGKDYHVEIGNAGILTGEGCFVQLKGTAQVQTRRDKSAISFSLEKKFATYYADKVKQLPVFLVVADVTRKKAWFVFLQQFLNEHPGWRQKNSATVYLPLGNDLADSKSFREAILEGKEWLRKRNPFAIQDSLGIAKEQVESVDRRCAVKIVADSDGNVRYEIRPKEPIPMKMTIMGDLDRIGPKLAKFTGGELVQFGPGECKIEGTEHFKGFHETGGEIQIVKKTSAILELTLRDEAISPLVTLGGIAGEFRAGLTEVSFEGELKKSPFSITFGPFGPTQCTVNFLMDVSKWNGQPISKLAYFDQLNSFFHGTTQAVSCEAHWLIDGNSVVRIGSETLPQKMLQTFASFFEFLDKARKVCKQFKIDPLWSDALLEDDFYDDVDQAYALFFEQEWKRKVGVGQTITAKLNSDGADIFRKSKPTDYYVIEESVFQILGHKIPIGTITKEFTNMTSEIGSVKDDPDCDLALRSTSDTFRIERLGEPPDFKPTEPQEAPPSEK